MYMRNRGNCLWYVCCPHDPTRQRSAGRRRLNLNREAILFCASCFGYIAGPDIDDRIKWIVDSLVEIFLAC